MTTAETRAAAAHRLERALDALNNGDSDCDDRARQLAEEAARLLDMIAPDPRADFGRQAAQYLALWLTNDEAAWRCWQNSSAHSARVAIYGQANKLANKITTGPHSALDSALADLLTRAAAWLDYDAIAQQLSSD